MLRWLHQRIVLPLKTNLEPPLLNQTTPASLLSNNIQTIGPSITHGFFTSRGGVSSGLYTSLNVGLGSGDDPSLVAENRSRICRSLDSPHDQPVTVSQCHSADVVVVAGLFEGERPQADAIVSKTPGLAIGVLTADCGPVLFADSKGGMVAAAHAGWQGALGGVVENTIEAMIELGARRVDIVATLGPCISQKNYEVGPEYFATFIDADEANERYFIPSSREGHHLFDLASYVVARLNNAGVAGDTLGICTYADEERFFSYRRSLHRNEQDYGRQISAIMVR